MLLLPKESPAQYSRVLHATIDAVVLTIILAPVLWWMLVRPLRNLAAMRERFLGDLFSTIEDERRRIAHELHDGVGQSLTLIISGLKSLPDTTSSEDLGRRRQNLQDFSERALADVKQLAAGLRPSLLDHLGLAPAIERVVADLRQHNGFEISCELETMRQLRLSERTEIAVFRIFQEAMNNAVKHSGAKHVSVQLVRESTAVLLKVCDDGRGIDPLTLKEQAATGGHLGLIGMRERVGQLDGELSVDSTSGKGTCITARLPLEIKRS